MPLSSPPAPQALRGSRAYEAVLRLWPVVRGRFAGELQVPAAALYELLHRQVPDLTAAAWPAVLHALVRHQLLHPVGPELFSLRSLPEPQPFRPRIEPAWQALWHTLRAGLVLPLGCVWSTRWLHGYGLACPPLLVLEVSQGELRSAAQLVHHHSPFRVVPAAGQELADPAHPAVLLQPTRPKAPTRAHAGVRIPAVEKLLVDTVLLGANTLAVSPQLAAALQRLRADYVLDEARLLHYAASRGAATRWEEVVAAPEIRPAA